MAISAAGLADNGSTISDMSFTESRHHHRVKGADSLLAEMSEQLHLQKELHLRRKDLEKLMKKDMMENIQKEHDEADDEDDMSMTRTSSDVRSDASLGGRHGMRRRRRGGGAPQPLPRQRQVRGGGAPQLGAAHWQLRLRRLHELRLPRLCDARGAPGRAPSRGLPGHCQEGADVRAPAPRGIIPGLSGQH